MIAIAVVAVMSGGTSSAQSALETTLAREEIDTQAEALRFIQSAYISDKGNKNSKYQKLWEAITSNANELSETDSDQRILQYMPDSCLELYETAENISTQKAFIINPRMLSSFDESTISDVYISTTDQFNDKFSKAMTYPHLIFSNDESNLIDTNASTSLYKAEGIYVVAVKDKDTTNIADGDTASVKNTAAFYDFYIRTCWYGTDADRPSTISTVIRLYDPAVTETTPTEP